MAHDLIEALKAKIDPSIYGDEISTTYADAVALVEKDMEKTITLCGSTRFFEHFRRAQLMLNCKGWLVYSIGIDTKSDDQLIESGVFPKNDDELAALLAVLDATHKRKISRSEAIMVIDVDGYIGDATRSEIAYAVKHGKKIYSYTKTVDFDKPAPFDASTLSGI